jgi:putative flippase GtrA
MKNSIYKKTHINKKFYLYVFFAALATILNIGTQILSIHIYSGIYNIELSVIFGVSIGLAAKYILDKRYIFQVHSVSYLMDFKTFFIYTVMGLLTTSIFIIFEFGFEYIYGGNKMRYLGGILGLIIGYALKYYLDKKYVFL